MGENPEPGSQLQCPECQAVLAEERRKFPWCECGWSSVPADWNIQHLPPSLRRMLNRNRQYARRLAAIDQQAAQLLERPRGKWLWRLYLALSLFLSIPVI